jgi:hypothetical protein
MRKPYEIDISNRCNQCNGVRSHRVLSRCCSWQRGGGDSCTIVNEEGTRGQGKSVSHQFAGGRFGIGLMEERSPWRNTICTNLSDAPSHNPCHAIHTRSTCRGRACTSTQRCVHWNACAASAHIGQSVITSVYRREGETTQRLAKLSVWPQHSMLERGASCAAGCTEAVLLKDAGRPMNAPGEELWRRRTPTKLCACCTRRPARRAAARRQALGDKAHTQLRCTSS